MVVQYLRLYHRPAQNAIRYHSRRRFSASAAPKPSSLRWVPFALGGICVGAGVIEYRYPQSVSLPISSLLTALKPSPALPPPALPEVRPKQLKPVVEEQQIEPVVEGQQIGAPKTPEPATVSAVNKAEEAEDEASSEAIPAPAEEEGCSFGFSDEFIEEYKKNHPEDFKETVSTENGEECSFGFSEEFIKEYFEKHPEEKPQTDAVPEPPSPEPSVEEAVPDGDLAASCPVEIPVVLAEEPGDTLGDVIGELVGAALTADTVPEPVPDKDETEIIMEALNSLDYEPVLSDTVLDLLVGKAATREKAVIATISRLENAMAGVVNDVEAALQHHNTTSALVVSAKLNAQSISTATSKESARELLEELLVSSSAVQAAFEEGELVTERVTTSFNKLSEIIDKAEQFNLKGPVGAARALLHKSRDDYFTSCEIAQENQVDHALLTHYRTSVVNRKKVLDKELEVLREHFPNQHLNLNQTFESAGSHHAQVDELNTLITYLSNKVARLESDIEARRSAELEKLRTVAEAQKEEDNKILEERLRAQADQLKYKYEVRQQEEVELAVAAARDEAARHAAKQAEIMKQEAREVTEKQIRDLTSFWSDEAALRESVVEVEYQCKLEKSNSLLRGVAGMLDVTSQRYDVLAYNQRLLNLTTAIFDSLNSGETVDVERLKDSVSTLKTEFNDDPLISAVTNSFPSRHISSFSRLKDRLSDLDRQCRRVSLMTSEDCGVGSRVLSRVMSALTLHDPNYDMTPQDGGSITLYFLQKAENEMKNNNLDLATRYLNQLIGEPKTLATDWLNDARDLLESRQSANVLLNYAKSRNNT